MAKRMSALPDAKAVRVNPSAGQLKELTAAMPNARRTRYGNLNVQTRVVARSKASTFIVVDDPEASSQQAISREEGDRIAQIQDDYIAGREMLVIDGYIGDAPEFRTPARLYIEEGERQHRRDAEAALLRRRLRGRLRARAYGHRHA